MALEDSSSLRRCDRISSSRSGGGSIRGSRKRGSDMIVSLASIVLQVQPTGRCQGSANRVGNDGGFTTAPDGEIEFRYTQS
jgi:hypothetical protein